MTFQLNRLALALSLPLVFSTTALFELAIPGEVHAAENPKKEILYWYDPMVPQQKFDEPGKSPFMDMDLVPRYADEGGSGTSIRIDPNITQSLGMRVTKVERVSISPSFEATGTLLFDERSVAVVQARAAGYVERVYPHAPEDVIKKDAPLADLLVPEWAAAQEEYLALRELGDPPLLAAAKQRLRLTGMPAEAIAELERSGKTRLVWTIKSPMSGVLRTLDVREGMTLKAGDSLAQINGLDTVWLEVAVPEAQISNLSRGQLVTARLPAFPDNALEGKVQAVLTQANLASRTIRLRVELPNPEQRLRPGMTAEVSVKQSAIDVLVIPTEAVIHTGMRSLVMVAEEQGSYRPVEIRTGREFNAKTEVLEGLQTGEMVVTSGQFLLDSEASLRGLTAQDLSPSTDIKPELHEAEGTIVSLDDGKIRLSHGPFKTLNMPGMTMSFRVADESLLSGLKATDQVRVGVRQSEEGLVIERIEKLGDKP